MYIYTNTYIYICMRIYIYICMYTYSCNWMQLYISMVALFASDGLYTMAKTHRMP